jgi:hypothetical protein
MVRRRPARQAINEVWRSILLNKFSKKIVFAMNEVDRRALSINHMKVFREKGIWIKIHIPYGFQCLNLLVNIQTSLKLTVLSPL